MFLRLKSGGYSLEATDLGLPDLELASYSLAGGQSLEDTVWRIQILEATDLGLPDLELVTYSLAGG